MCWAMLVRPPLPAGRATVRRRLGDALARHRGGRRGSGGGARLALPLGQAIQPRRTALAGRAEILGAPLPSCLRPAWGSIRHADPMHHVAQPRGQLRAGGARRGPSRGMECRSVGKLAGAVDGDKRLELAFFGMYFGNINVEGADRIGLELFLLRLVTFHSRQAADTVPLKATV